jgi:hypothetical protein
MRGKTAASYSRMTQARTQPAGVDSNHSAMALLGICHRTIHTVQRPQNKAFLLRKPFPVDPTSFAERLRVARVTLGHTQTEMARNFQDTKTHAARWGFASRTSQRYKHVAPPALGALRRSDLFIARAQRKRIKLRGSDTESIGHAVHHPIDRCRPARAERFQKQFPIRIVSRHLSQSVISEVTRFRFPLPI